MTKMFKTCFVAIVIYLGLMVFYTSCDWIRKNQETITPDKLKSCASIIEECVNDIREAKKTENPVDIMFAVNKCSSNLDQGLCAVLIKEVSDG